MLSLLLSASSTVIMESINQVANSKNGVLRVLRIRCAGDDLFRDYRISYNSYKCGTVQIKIPNRPLCQMQDFVVGLHGGWPVPAGVGGSGTFMRCE